MMTPQQQADAHVRVADLAITSRSMVDSGTYVPAFYERVADTLDWLSELLAPAGVAAPSAPVMPPPPRKGR